MSEKGMMKDSLATQINSEFVMVHYNSYYKYCVRNEEIKALEKYQERSRKRARIHGLIITRKKRGW